MERVLPKTELELNSLRIQKEDLPIDSIQVISFSPAIKDNVFAIGSWDGSVKVILFKDAAKKLSYEVVKNYSLDSPVLDLKWIKYGTQLLVTGGDFWVRLLEVKNQEGVTKLFGDQGVIYTCLSNHKGADIFATVSIDGKIKYWSTTQPIRQIVEIPLNFRPIGGDSNTSHMIIAGEKNHIAFFNMSDGDSTHKVNYQNLESEVVPEEIKIAINTKDYIIGTCDGKVYHGEMKKKNLDIWENNRKMFFKAHKSEQSIKKVFPIKSIGFLNPTAVSPSKIFTCSNNKNCKIWDFKEGSSIGDMAFTFIEPNLTAAAISQDSDYLVSAYGYDWSFGVSGLQNLKNANIEIVITRIIYDD